MAERTPSSDLAINYHLSTHVVTGDDRQDALVRPGYKLSVTILNISTVVYIQPSDDGKIAFHGGKP